MKKIICIFLAIFSITFFGCSSKSTSSVTKETPKVSEDVTKNSSLEDSLVNANEQKDDEKDEQNENTSISTPKTNPNKIIKKPSTNLSSNNSKKSDLDSSKEAPTLPSPSENKLSEEEVMNLVLNAEYALKGIFNGTAYYSKNIIVQDNYTYGEVTNFKSREEIKQSLAPYFTEQVIENILNKYLITHNGKLYFVLGNAGLRVDYKTCKKEFNYEKNKITITLTEQDNTADIFSEVKTLELINGKWLFTDFWYV